jgi:hypothetical protein
MRREYAEASQGTILEVPAYWNAWSGARERPQLAAIVRKVQQLPSP